MKDFTKFFILNFENIFYRFFDMIFIRLNKKLFRIDKLYETNKQITINLYNLKK